MPTQLAVLMDNQSQKIYLSRSLGALETWGFGLSGLLLWVGTAPGMHAAMGANAIWVWIPGAVAGILLNLQMQRLGNHLPNISGGTPNYTAHLLSNYPGLARYGAIGYWLGWVSVPAMNGIILTEFIKTNLDPLGIESPETLLKIGFTCLPFIVGLSGTRTLGILHLFFVIPACGLLVAFCVQGIGWLEFSPASPGFFPTTWPQLNFIEWAKWYFIAIYAVYACETASTFVADSRRPDLTLRCLPFAASLIPVVYLGGSWILLRLGNQPNQVSNIFLDLLAVASPFWGNFASFLLTFLIASGCLLSSATAVSNSGRILYQLALDKHLSPVFAVISPQGVLEPGLLFTLSIGFLCLVWQDVTRVVMITGTGYIVSMILVHLALWLNRKRPYVLGGWLAFGFLLVEVVVLIVGGLAWSWQDLLLGLLLPIGILLIDRGFRRISFPPFHTTWWLNRYNSYSRKKVQDFLQMQVLVLIFLVCGATTIGWWVRDWLDNSWRPNTLNSNLFVLLLLTVAFVGVAIACWTTLPQVASIAEAKEVAENLFTTALETVSDPILVLDENGAIVQANPAAVSLFEMNAVEMIGHRLSEFFSGFIGELNDWKSRSEQRLNHTEKGFRIIDTTISRCNKQKFPEYIVILRDITDRVQSEQALRQSEATLKQQTAQLEQTLSELKQTQAQLIQTEKMSSLGQLVAGVAHEINNPVNFIYGNITPAQKYTEEILQLIEFYEQGYLFSDPKIQDIITGIDLDFLKEDLPKTLNSMQIGAERIREIVLSLRNFSRLDEAVMKLVDIHEGIDSTLLILQHRLESKGGLARIEIIKEYGKLPLVECYAGQMNQVFMNILNNAIDALLEVSNSTIRIHTKVINEDWVRISIKDNGIGINDSLKNRIFDYFFTTKPVGKGTGLGLSISYQIVVNKHGGKLNCISQPGEGTEFLIEIPIRQRLGEF